MNLLKLFKQKTEPTHDDLVARIETVMQGRGWKLFEKKRDGDYVVIGEQVNFDKTIAQKDGVAVTYRDHIKQECREDHRGHWYFAAFDGPLLEDWDYIAGCWTSLLGIKPTEFEKGKIRTWGEDTIELWLPHSMYVAKDQCAFNFTITPSEKALRTASNLLTPVEYWRAPFTPTIYLGLKETKR